MLDINLIRNNSKYISEMLLKKGCNVDFTNFLENDQNLKTLQKQNDELKAKKNKVSATIAEKKRNGEDVSSIFDEMKSMNVEIDFLDSKIKSISDENLKFLEALPNIPDEDLLSGEKENNKVIYEYKIKPIFDFEFKNHVDLCESLNLIDYKRGAKLAGNGNWIYTDIGARLEWALLNFFMDEHLNDGYQFMMIPHMLTYNCGYGAGQFPKFNDDVFWIKTEEGEQEKFLLPTSETALVNLYSNEILKEDELPKKFFGYSPCYRKEAGSYRAKERGMIRGHQFNKIEMIQYAKPEDSAASFEEMVNKAKVLLEKLGLHFRVTKLAAGDCSASMARTYDIEVYIPSMDYIEVSSVSNAKDYQARRNNTKFRNKDTQKLEFVHTLNGSGLATSRVIPAIVEQNQQKDGSVKIPDVLVKYMGGITEIKLK